MPFALMKIKHNFNTAPTMITVRTFETKSEAQAYLDNMPKEGRLKYEIVEVSYGLDSIGNV